MIFAQTKSSLEHTCHEDTDLSAERRLAVLLHAHHKFIWRCVRRFGVGVEAVDDVVQEVFIVLARRLGDVQTGKERAFLTQTAFRLAANWRRGVRRRPLTHEMTDELVACESNAPDHHAEQRQTRQLLDLALQALSDEHRAVLVLAEVDELSRNEIAELLGWSAGTVASRLRAAKEKFAEEVNRLWSGFSGAEP